MSRKFRDWMYCRQKRNIRPVLFQTVNHDLYKGILQCLRDTIQQRRPELWITGKLFLLHDNVLPQTAIIRQRIFDSTSNHSIAAYAISPNLPLCDFILSRNWNEHWKAVAVMTFMSCRRRWQNSSAEFQKGFSKTASKTPRNEGNCIFMQAEAISKGVLSTRV